MSPRRPTLTALGAAALAWLSAGCGTPCESLQDTCDGCLDAQVKAACESVVRVGSDDQCEAAESNYPLSGCR